MYLVDHLYTCTFNLHSLGDDLRPATITCNLLLEIRDMGLITQLFIAIIPYLSLRAASC